MVDYIIKTSDGRPYHVLIKDFGKGRLVCREICNRWPCYVPMKDLGERHTRSAEKFPMEGHTMSRWKADSFCRETCNGRSCYVPRINLGGKQGIILPGKAVLVIAICLITFLFVFSRGHLIIGFQVQKLFTVNGKEMTLQSELKFADLAGR